MDAVHILYSTKKNKAICMLKDGLFSFGIWEEPGVSENGQKIRTSLCTKTQTCSFDGAGGGTRTHTVSLPKDFESSSSTIPTHRHIQFFALPRTKFRILEGSRNVRRDICSIIRYVKWIIPEYSTRFHLTYLHFESATSTISSHRQVCLYNLLT